MKPEFCDIITDCALDANGQNRLWLRAKQLYPNTAVHVVGVRHPLQAAGNLIDALDQVRGAPGIILVNVAPRHGEEGKKWPNGTPFGYFWYEKTLVVSTIADATLSLVQKFGLASEVHVFDIPTVMDWAVKEGHISKEEADLVVISQFRSLTFQPIVSSWVAQGFAVPVSTELISEIAKAIDGPTVWEVDNFGNCKTTMTEDEPVPESLQEYRTFNRLSDVPDDGEPAITIGSSGFKNRRFRELVIGGKSAAQELGLSVGALIC